MKEYFNIEVRNDSEGCLQDVHWFMGDFGWFPTYALGNVISAQLYMKFEQSFPSWDHKVENGEFIFIKDFLSKVHQLGAKYDFKGTLENVFGNADLTEEPLLIYLNERYGNL